MAQQDSRALRRVVASHPEAFADHAAEFWLDAGDAARARRLAQMNLEVRQTPRAHELLARATAVGALAPMPNQPSIYAAHGESGDAHRRSE